MEVCYFCKNYRPAYTVDFTTKEANVSVNMCEKCFISFREQETSIRRLYGSRWFWFKIILITMLIGVGFQFTPLGRLMKRFGVYRHLTINSGTAAWFALRLSEVFSN